MALYPSLEDMKVDQMIQAQNQLLNSVYNDNSSQMINAAPNTSYTPNAPSGSDLYPALNDYMGLELSEDVIMQNMPEYSRALVSQELRTVQASSGLVSTVTDLSTIGKANITHGIRQLVLCKGTNGKVGVRVKAINKGVFVCLVDKSSPAALAGLRFGDQILEINNTLVAGFTMDQVHDLFKKSSVNGISVVVRDRPFERTITLHKDSLGHVGFQIKNGKIVSIVKDSSAARNGVLIEHHLLEINGQNVVGLKDKEVTRIIDESDRTVTCTVIPTFIYDHMIKNMASSLLKGSMDHSIPNL